MAATLLCHPLMSQAAPDARPSVEKVRLQLKWLHQFQFAGYYAAVEQGYYANEGLQVEISERNLKKSVVKQVVANEAEYGVGDAGLLSQYAQGEPITALAAIFQHNPVAFFSLQSSGIVSPYEMAGKRIMSDVLSSNEAPLSAMLSGANIKPKDYTLLPQTNDYSLLTQGKVDVISGYITDEPFYYKTKGIKINVIAPQNYGIDFYGDILFTSQRELRDHPGRADRFLRATLKGWRYALEHPKKIIQLIQHKYRSRLPLEHLYFEADEIRKLILPDAIPLGYLDMRRLTVMAKSYADSGFNRPLTEVELAAFVHAKPPSTLTLSKAEQAWLDMHPVIRVGIDRDFAPYESIDDEGNYVGMAADYMHLLEKKLGVRFEIIGHDKSWAEILDLAKRGELDMLSAAVKTPERSQYLDFTEPYKAAYAVIIDNGQGGFVGGLDNLAGKRVAVEKGYFIQELLEKNHPQIQLVLTGNTLDAMKLVIDGQADAYIGDASTANYIIKKEDLPTLRFSGQTQYRSQHSVAVTKTNPELMSIIGKAMSSISKEEADEIFNRWLGLRIEHGIKIETLVKYGSLIALVFLLLTYWLMRLRHEIAARKATESSLEASQLRYRRLAESSPVGIVVHQEGRFVYLNPAAIDLFGAETESELLGKLIMDFIHPDFREAVQARIQWGMLHGGSAPALEEKFIRLDGTPIDVEVQGAIIEYEGKPAVQTNVHNITERKQSEEKLRLAASVFSHAREGITITDPDANIIEVNAAFTNITGYSREEVLGKNPRILKSGLQSDAFYLDMWQAILTQGHWNGEIWNRRKSGEVYPEILTISAVHDAKGNTLHYVALFSDITPIKQHQHALERIAHYDALTNLPNRVLLADRMEQGMIQCLRRSRALAVAYLDLDGFKTVNDCHGHNIGDALLIEVSQRMKAALREGDTLARIGGDEFVAVLVDLESPHDYEPVIERLLHAASETVTLDGTTLQVSASIGVTLYPQDNADADQLMRHADQAMYQAKQSGKNRYQLFMPK